MSHTTKMLCECACRVDVEAYHFYLFLDMQIWWRTYHKSNECGATVRGIKRSLDDTILMTRSPRHLSLDCGNGFMQCWNWDVYTTKMLSG